MSSITDRGRALLTAYSTAPLSSGQRALFVLGAGIFTYQVVAYCIHKIAHENLKKGGVAFHVMTAGLTLGWVAVMIVEKSPLAIYLTFIAMGLIAFLIHRSPPSPPLEALPQEKTNLVIPELNEVDHALPPGLIDLTDEAQTFEGERAFIKNEFFIKSVEQAVKDSSKQNVLLVGKVENTTRQITYLPWAIAHKKLSSDSPLNDIKIVGWNLPKVGEIKKILKYFKNHPNCFLFLQDAFSIPFGDGDNSSETAKNAVGKMSSAIYSKKLRVIAGTGYQKFSSVSGLHTAWHVQVMNPESQQFILVQCTGESKLGTGLPKGLLDMTAEAKLHPEWAYGGAEAQKLSRLMKTVLLQPHKKSIMLVGKTVTHAVQYLARTSQDVKIVRLDPLHFRKKTSKDTNQDIIKFLKNHPETWCYVEEAHGLVGDGVNRVLDFTAICEIKNALIEGGLRLIGSTTPSQFEDYCAPNKRSNHQMSPDGYRQEPKHDLVFDTYWIRYNIPELTVQECTDRLRATQPFLGNKVTDEAVAAAVILADILTYERSRLEVASELLSQGCAEATLLEGPEAEVTPSDVVRGAMTLKRAPEGYTEENFLEEFQKKLPKLNFESVESDDDIL